MIKQFNLLDKVWYVDDINTKEVTITILDGSLKNKTAKFTPKAAQ